MDTDIAARAEDRQMVKLIGRRISQTLLYSLSELRESETQIAYKHNMQIKKANDKFKTETPYLSANQGDMFLDILSHSHPPPSSSRLLHIHDTLHALFRKHSWTSTQSN